VKNATHCASFGGRIPTNRTCDLLEQVRGLHPFKALQPMTTRRELTKFTLLDLDTTWPHGMHTSTALALGLAACGECRAVSSAALVL